MVVKRKRIVKSVKKAVTKTKANSRVKTKVSEKKEHFTEAQELQPTIEQISEYIQTRAYYIWKQMDKPGNKDLDIWIKAEKQIMIQLKKK